MRALLDVNVLIALLDTDHTLHVQAIEWFAEHAQLGWASCPITQNGCTRIISNPRYPNPVPVHLVIQRLADACADPVHQFWADDISLVDTGLVDATRIHGPKQLTDVYLLALAVNHHARLATFDDSIALDAVRGAKPQNLLSL